jgi:bifunctional enzyme CysN/CysC
MPPANGLIWITGYSGAGKTTVAKLAAAKLRAMAVPVVLLDGDDLRSILAQRFGHSVSDRRQLAYVYSRLCQTIARCDVTVVIATIAMFEAVRMENRAANVRYLEVYLDVPLSVRQERDPKGLYRAAALGGTSTDAGFEEPANPDLVIANYGETAPDVAATLIAERYVQLHADVDTQTTSVDEFAGQVEKQVQYWDQYYARRKAPLNPSPFALFCAENYLESNSSLLEFGCGNGRDSFYFAKNHRVTAVDQSLVVIRANRTRAKQEGALNAEFVHGEFGSNISGLPSELDAVYGRFVLHAMPEDVESKALREAWRLLKAGGRLFLEFRTTRDPLMNQGHQIGEYERVTDHYRRFIDFEQLRQKLVDMGFELEFAVEKQGLASFGSDDPVVGRVVATRR